MRFHEFAAGSRLPALNEGPEADLDAIKLASGAASAWMNWLKRKNEATALGDIDGVWLRRLGDIAAYCLPAEACGLPYDDLYFGIASREQLFAKRNANGIMISGRDEGRTVYYVIVGVGGEPGQAVDAAWSIKWDTFNHEMIHYFDYKRGYSKHVQRQIRQRMFGPKADSKPRTTLGQYFNDPLEFNAHYQQGLGSIMNEITHLANAGRFASKGGAEMFPTFRSFDRTYRYHFPKDFWRYLNKRYRRRFESRFYQLWKLCHDQWPNIDAIQKGLREFEEIRARLDAEDAAQEAEDRATAAGATASTGPAPVAA